MITHSEVLFKQKLLVAFEELIKVIPLMQAFDSTLCAICRALPRGSHGIRSSMPQLASGWHRLGIVLVYWHVHTRTHKSKISNEQQLFFCIEGGIVVENVVAALKKQQLGLYFRKSRSETPVLVHVAEKEE